MSNKAQELIAKVLSKENYADEESSIYDAYYIFIKNFGYIPIEEFLGIPYRVVYELFKRIKVEYDGYKKGIRSNT